MHNSSRKTSISKKGLVLTLTWHLARTLLLFSGFKWIIKILNICHSIMFQSCIFIYIYRLSVSPVRAAVCWEISSYCLSANTAVIKGKLKQLPGILWVRRTSLASHVTSFSARFQFAAQLERQIWSFSLSLWSDSGTWIPINSVCARTTIFLDFSNDVFLRFEQLADHNRANENGSCKKK